MPWLVHFYTALGAACALASAEAVITGHVRVAFLWLFVSVSVIDATDGWLARRARVKERTPGFDGAKLDDIVDYLTYVFVPALMVVRLGIVPPALAWPLAIAMLLSSAYGFASLDAKTSDHFFMGFPSYWNLLIFYLVVARWPLVVNAAAIAVCVAGVFVRVGYVYPTRMPVLRKTTLGLSAAWAVMLVTMLWSYPATPPALIWTSLSYPAYYFALSFTLQARRTP